MSYTKDLRYAEDMHPSDGGLCKEMYCHILVDDEGTFPLGDDAYMQLVCCGCGEHFFLTAEDIERNWHSTPIDIAHHAVICVRCKVRRQADQAAARGLLQ